MAYERLPAGVRAVVAGGGLAGLAAATVLAERGARVTVVEREAYLGGRAGAWTDRLATGEAFEMERGFHAFFRQYYNLRALIRRVDPELTSLVPLDDYPLLGPNGERESFAALPRRTPLNLLALVSRTPSMRWRDVLRIEKTRAAAMIAFDAARTYGRWDAMTARDYLDSLAFPPRARQMLFDVFAHSFFNPEDDLSAAELLMQFHFYFVGNPEGLVFDVMRRPFSKALFGPLASYLEARGVDVRRGDTVERVEPRTGGKVRVELGSDEAIDADAVVLALDVGGLSRVVASSPALGDAPWREAIAALKPTLPFAVWRLWLDRPCAPGRAPFAGTTGIGLLDNISLYHLLEDESRSWASRMGGSVVELHAYAVPESLDEEAIRRDLLAGLHALYPETRDAKIVEDRFLLRRDCPAFPPGSWKARPAVETPADGVFLAGDFVKLPQPSALMERAVASGFLAATRVLERWNVRGEEIRSVPPRGVLAAIARG